MSQTIKVVKNDKLYDLNFTLQDASGNAVNLTNASSISLKVQKVGATALKFTGNMIKVVAASGTCKYQVAAGNFDETGEYHAEIEVTFSGGQISTFSDIYIIVLPELPRS